MSLSLAILSVMSQLILAHVYNSAEELITSFRCNETYRNSNGWSFGGVILAQPTISSYCPLPDGSPCYTIRGDPTTPGWARNSFSTVGYSDIWVSIDVNSLWFEAGDQAWITFTDGSWTHAILIADEDTFSGSVITPLLSSFLSNAPDCQFTITINGDDTLDYLYFSNIKIYGVPITTTTIEPTTYIQKGELITRFRCNDTSNGWVFGGTYYYYADQASCPDPSGAPCFALVSSASYPAYAENSFSTVGYSDIWLTIDLSNAAFESCDTAWIHFADDSVQIANSAPYSGTVPTPFLSSTMNNNPHNEFMITIQTLDESKDYLHFSNIKVYGTPITQNPTNAPTSSPTPSPTSLPTQSPTPIPSSAPTSVPSQVPTPMPTSHPSLDPTKAPCTITPTHSPTSLPSAPPTPIPSQATTTAPTQSPSSSFVNFPSTAVPTNAPTSVPTAMPSDKDTLNPTWTPSTNPSQVPTMFPSANPTKSPSIRPSANPTKTESQNELQIGNELIKTTNENSGQVVSDIETTNSVATGDEQEDEHTFYILTIALISIIVATFCSVMVGICYFCKRETKAKQKGMTVLQQVDSMSISPQMSPKVSPPSIEENEICISIKTTPSADNMVVAASPMIGGEVFLDQLMAPSSIQLEGRMKRMSYYSQSDLYDEVIEPVVQTGGTTAGTKKILEDDEEEDDVDGVEEILLQRGHTTESNALCDGNATDTEEQEDSIYDAAGPTVPAEINAIDALPETTRDGNKKQEDLVLL